MKRKVTARATPMSSDFGKSGKTKKISVSTMTANEMNAYIQSLECVDVAGEIADIMPTSDVMEMANYLKQTYQRINKTESQLLKSYVDFGNNLKLAQERFRLEKRMTKFSQKWGEWIMINANISPSMQERLCKWLSWPVNIQGYRNWLLPSSNCIRCEIRLLKYLRRMSTLVSSGSSKCCQPYV